MLIAFTVYVPTNRGLAFVREEGLKEIAAQYKNISLIEARGEQIPESVELQKDSKNLVMGITGADLVRNYESIMLSRERDSLNEDFFNEELKESLYPLSTIEVELNLGFKGPYQEAIFGLPSLCVLGRGGMPLDVYKEAYASRPMSSFPLFELYSEATRIPYLGDKKIVIPKRYELFLRRKYLSDALSNAKIKMPTIISLEGKVDVTAAADASIDYAIDIVVTGTQSRKSGLGIFCVLYQSDGVILRNPEAEKDLYAFRAKENSF